jgi:hypothetical protein
VPSGSTVLVEPKSSDSEDGQEPDVKLSVIEPAPRPTPVGVGAEGGSGEGGEEESPQEPPAPAGDASEGE